MPNQYIEYLRVKKARYNSIFRMAIQDSSKEPTEEPKEEKVTFFPLLKNRHLNPDHFSPGNHTLFVRKPEGRKISFVVRVPYSPYRNYYIDPFRENVVKGIRKHFPNLYSSKIFPKGSNFYHLIIYPHISIPSERDFGMNRYFTKDSESADYVIPHSLSNVIGRHIHEVLPYPTPYLHDIALDSGLLIPDKRPSVEDLYEDKVNNSNKYKDYYKVRNIFGNTLQQAYKDFNEQSNEENGEKNFKKYLRKYNLPNYYNNLSRPENIMHQMALEHIKDMYK